MLARWPTDLAVLVPVYNHAGHIARVIHDLKALGASVLVVDDGSTDASGTVAEAAGASVLPLAHNRGKAAALEVGLNHLAKAGWQRVLTCDADGQHPIMAVTRLLIAAEADRSALWVGQRCMRGAPARSRIGRLCSNLGVALCCGQWPGDSQSGLRIYPARSTVALGTGSSRFAWEVEIMVKARRAGVALKQHPVPVLYPRTRISHFRPVADTMATLSSLLVGAGRRFRPAARQALAGTAHQHEQGGDCNLIR